jgi:hypothetical protein
MTKKTELHNKKKPFKKPRSNEVSITRQKKLLKTRAMAFAQPVYAEAAGAAGAT